MRPRKTGRRAVGGPGPPARNRFPGLSPEEQAEYHTAGDGDAAWFEENPDRTWRLRMAQPSEQKMMPPGTALVRVEQLRPGVRLRLPASMPPDAVRLLAEMRRVVADQGNVP